MFETVLPNAILRLIVVILIEYARYTYLVSQSLPKRPIYQSYNTTRGLWCTTMILADHVIVKRRLDIAIKSDAHLAYANT